MRRGVIELTAQELEILAYAVPIEKIPARIATLLKSSRPKTQPVRMFLNEDTVDTLLDAMAVPNSTSNSLTTGLYKKLHSFRRRLH